MVAKEPVSVRDDESSPHLRGRAIGETSHGSSAHDNVVPLPLRDAERDRLEAGVRDAFARSLRAPLAAAKADTALLAAQLVGPQSDRVKETLAQIDTAR